MISNRGFVGASPSSDWVARLAVVLEQPMAVLSFPTAPQFGAKDIGGRARLDELSFQSPCVTADG